MTDPAAPYGFHHGTTIPRKSPPAEHHDVRHGCKRCGAEDLVWEMHGDHWRLVDVGGNRHVCPPKGEP